MRTDIQTLRGLAVSLVVLYHAEIGVIGGYLGVDVFFVISGYLITGLICRNLDAGQFSFSDFYWRRAKRLLPAAYVTFFFTSLAMVGLATATELSSYVQQVLGAITFTANFVLAEQVNYFDTAAAFKPLLHVWSLAVEEQYYFLAPLIFWIIPKHLRVRVVIGFLAVSLALCFAFARSKPHYTFFMLPTRSWELSIGALLAVGSFPQLGAPAHRMLGSCAIIVLVLLSVQPIDEIHPRWDALLVCVATALAIQTRPGILERGPLAFALARIGDISFSLYLVHWPIFSIVRQVYFGELPLSLRIACIAISILLAVALYRYVERPFHLGEFRPSRIVLSAVSALLFVTTAGPWLYLHLSSHAADWVELRRPNRGLDQNCDQTSGAFTIWHRCQTASDPKVAIWGDSFAMHLVSGVVAQDHGLGLVQLTRSTCSPVLPDSPEPAILNNASCADFNWSVFNHLRQSEAIKYVILATAYNPAKLQSTVKALRAIGKRVIFVAAPPSIGVNFSPCVERQNTGQLTFNAPLNCDFGLAASNVRGSDLIKGAKDLAAAEGVAVIWPSDVLCDIETCHTHDGRLPFLCRLRPFIELWI